MVVKLNINDGDELRDWAVNNGWCLDWVIEKLDEQERWDEAFDLLESVNCDGFEDDTELNDALRFGLDDLEFFNEEEDEENEEEEDEEEENENTEDEES